jgi:hypothetical protein
MADHSISRRRWRVLCASASMLVPFVLAGAAHAQTTDTSPSQLPSSPASSTTPEETGSDIVVTASRISRAPVTDQPVVTLGTDELSKRGYTNVGLALMQQLPSFGTPATAR